MKYCDELNKNYVMQIWLSERVIARNNINRNIYLIKTPMMPNSIFPRLI